MARIESVPAAILSEPARELPVRSACDVAVIGGGVAGVAAAVAAARNGIQVCLVEKQCALGGLATLGNVIYWLPICDGRGRQVIGGLGEELLRLSVADLKRNHPSAHFYGIPPCWQPGGNPAERARFRFRTAFNPSSYLFALEELIRAAGVALRYDTLLCAVHRQADRITHLILEDKGGRFALAARCVIDATGDADVCHYAGEPTESLDSNVPAGWHYLLRDGELSLEQFSRRYCPRGTRTGLDGPFFRGDDGLEVTGQILATRQGIRERLAELRAEHPHADLQLFHPATIACMRMTRRLVSNFSLAEQHVHQWFDDAIGLTGDWRQPGPVYALPWRALRAPRTANLAVAGRCISVEPAVWDVTRAIPGCAVTGEAAGTAAALAVRDFAGNLSALPVAVLQAQLRRQGALLTPELVREAPVS